MEVHHPTHRRPKKWHHYIFEFFMLFLAISLGFYVDNLREHYVENKREKQYMHMLVEDLKTDIHVLDSNCAFRQDREVQLERLLALLGQKDLSRNATLIYKLADSTDGYETFNRDDRTIQQLKGTGGMRMVRNDSVTAAIVDYDNYIITEIDWNNRTEANRVDNYKQLRFQLFDAQQLGRLVKNDSNVTFTFMPHSAMTINEVAGSIFQVMRISGTARENGKIAMVKAAYLIDLIERQYGFKH